MPTLVKVTALYKLDSGPQRTLNRRVRNINVHDPLAHETDDLFIYRGWCALNEDGELDPMTSNFGDIRRWLSTEFIRRYPENTDLLGASSFSRCCFIRGWPAFERVPQLPTLPVPPEESTS